MGQLFFAGAIHTVEQAKIDAARITQKSGNERRGAETALQNFSASLGNQRRMQAAGSQANDITGNTARIARSLTASTMQGRIQAAEELGSVAAMAGAAGVAGASVEAYNETARLQNAIREEAVNRSFGEQAWAAGQQKGNLIQASVAGLDNNVYRASLDYTQYLDHKKPGTFERVLGIGLTAAATVFGGPQAGSAVMGMFEARQAARNGDMAGASASLTGAIQNGASAIGSIAKTSGGPSGTAKAGNVSSSGMSLFGGETGADGFELNTSFFKNSRPQWGSVLLK